MRKLFIIFTIIALFVGTIATHAHAHICMDENEHITIELKSDAEHNESMHCVESCHTHHHMVDTSTAIAIISPANNNILFARLTNAPTSELLYGLKRPPRS